MFLAGALTAGMVGFGGVAVAQDDATTAETTTTTTTTTTTETTTATTTTTTTSSVDTSTATTTSSDGDFVEIPLISPPRVSTASICGGGVGSVDVTLTNRNDVELTYQVVLGDDLTQEVTVAAGGTETVVFDDVAPGDHDVLIKQDGDLVTYSSASVDRCSEITEPVDDPLQVFVRCEDGVGLVTIRVFNTEGESRTYTISVDDLELPGELELGVDEYAIVVDEEPAPDGTYAVRVVAEGIDHTETAEVACAPAPAPTSTATTTTPVAQPRPAPAANSGGLASTGAAVGGIALLAVLALGLGGALVIASRRRRATPSND